MPALDFTEIATAHAGNERDQFELFARDFLEQQGFQTIVPPDRGADAGRDLVVRERRVGPGGAHDLDWLVSCKHKAHSGDSVGTAEETNIRDRLETHHCAGFIAFYSTIPSSTLAIHLRGLLPQYGLLIYDNEVIEAKLLDSPSGRSLAARYMPNSFDRWGAISRYVSPAVATPPSIRDRFREEIRYLEKYAGGRALAMNFMSRLEFEFSTGTILSEMLRMHEDGVITWEGAPATPAALSQVSIIE
jgi:hypothetical protein